MKRFRNSRILKIIFTVTAVLCSLLLFFNIIFAVLISYENLIYTDIRQLQQKVYSYLYNYTSRDLMNYLSLIEQTGRNNSYTNYNTAETELYKNKYSPENSNIYFEIKDDSGNIMLNNSALSPGCESFSFSSKYESVLNSDLINYSNTNFIYNTDIDSVEKNESESDSIFGIFEIKNKTTGKHIKLTYYHTENIDRIIYNFFNDILSSIPFDLSEISINQEEFFSDPGNNTVYNRYSYEDSSAFPKTFSTVLTANNTHVKINYTYYGSFSLDCFLTRLSEASCVLFNSRKEITELNYIQKENNISEIHVSVPVITEAKDIYHTAARICSLALFYRDNLVVFSAVSILILFISLVFLFYSAGYSKGEKIASAKGIHRIPFDITLILLILTEFLLLLFFMFSDAYEIGLPVLIYTALMMLVFIFYTITVRKRAGTLKNNNASVILYRKIKVLTEPLADAKNFKIVIVLTVMFFIICTAAEIIFLLKFQSAAVSAVILTVLRIVELPLLTVFLCGIGSLHNAAKNISEGKINYKINTSLLFGPIKKHADYLNNISSSVNAEIEKRVKSESFKTELITNVSHDLKTPLTSIVNYIDILKKEKIDNPDALKYIEIIDRQSQRLKKLTADIVDASKAATGNITVIPEYTLLNVLLQQTAGEYSDKLEESSLILIEDISDEPISVFTDGRLLWRIINNLMNNICKYSMKGSRVYISLKKYTDSAVITFKNISATELNINPEELTERFIRGDKSRNTEGSGLGLSIAKSISEILGAEMNIGIDGDLFKVTIKIPESFNK